MKKYQIYYNNTVEINNVAEFYTLEEAKNYCSENTKGYDKICDNDNCYEGRSITSIMKSMMELRKS